MHTMHLSHVVMATGEFQFKLNLNGLVVDTSRKLAFEFVQEFSLLCEEVSSLAL